MEDFTIKTFLSEFDHSKRSGSCNACGHSVTWSKQRVAAHIRASCPNASDELKRKFAKIVEMISSSATSERTWSIFRFIHNRLRNRLTNDRVKKLVFLYTNSVLLDNVDKNNYVLSEVNEDDDEDFD